MACFTFFGIRLISMNPITKALIACAAVCIALYLLVAEFLGTTDRLKGSLDVKSLAHTREQESQAKSAKKPELVAVAPVPTQETPQRDTTEERIDAHSVLPRSVPTVKEGVEEGKDAAYETGDEEAAEDAAVVGLEEDKPSAAQTLLKETLGIDEPPPPVRAVDVSYSAPENCETSGVALAPVAVQYRFESPTITGASLRELELLMTEYRRCDGGQFQFAHNLLGKEDATPQLMQRRLDELKYFFLQHRVSKTALRFPDDS